jgi:predicted TPR repeat methyltransferase
MLGREPEAERAMAGADKTFLDGVYSIDDTAETKVLYADWAASYEDEIRANGYATPGRCAAALARFAGDKSVAILDLGCGTGLSGEAFRAAGFEIIDGTDFSREMLDHARAKPGLYRNLTLGDLSNPIPAAPGDYTHAAAVGVISPGHAPPETIDQVMALLPAGGCFVFSLNDHALEDPSYEAPVHALADAGSAEVVFREHGDHLPGQNLKSVVYVLRKA